MPIVPAKPTRALLKPALLVIASSVMAGASYAGISIDEALSREERLANSIVIVANIESIIDPADTTFGKPPRLRARLIESLRGNLRPSEIVVIWEPPPSDVDWGGDGADEARRAWAANVLRAPRVGTRWILAGTWHDTFYASDRTPFSTAARADTKSAIRRGEAMWSKMYADRRAEDRAGSLADLGIQRQANLKLLYDESTDIMVGQRATGELSGYGSTLTIRIDRAIKGRGIDPPGANLNLIDIIGESPGARMTNHRFSVYGDYS